MSCRYDYIDSISCQFSCQYGTLYLYKFVYACNTTVRYIQCYFVNMLRRQYSHDKHIFYFIKCFFFSFFFADTTDNNYTLF